ncbi:hypothetical protein DPMN_011709 [Dreissena polymorpha]|uniref:MAM domain-containing protein n=1 Tax=Dreissena polymorpha TaxID=45954 RepID=A0A9D4N462_DREPO|nr:hypothetical protein DPMN_011709 [Dreissena polymorpha]
MYIESSAPQRPGQKAWLVSDYASGNVTQCMTFYYSMYGANIGTLNLYIMTGVALPSTPVFSKSGNQGNMWIMGQATLQSPQTYRVIFSDTNDKLLYCDDEMLMIDCFIVIMRC